MRLNTRSFRPTLTSTIGSLILIGAVALVLVMTMGAERADVAKDKADIRLVVMRAFELTHGQTTRLPEPYASSVATDVPDEVKSGMRSKALSDLRDVYSDKSPILKDRTELMQREIDKQGVNGYRDLGGGMRSIRNLTIEVNGDSAVAEADIRAWGKFVMQGKTFTPENETHFRYTLSREDGMWRITREDLTFLSGQEP